MLYLAVRFSTTLTTHLSTHRVRVELSRSVYQEPVSYQVKYLCLLGKSPLKMGRTVYHRNVLPVWNSSN